MTLGQLTQLLEQLAPPALQESYDNAGLLVGNSFEMLTGVLVSLDATEAVVEEAVARGCNLVVSHHPLIFGGLKRLTGSNYVERTVLKAIRHGVALYAIHTNLDNVLRGVNAKISSRLGLENCAILQPKKGMFLKLVTFVPEAAAAAVREALSQAGAGQLGNYTDCAFQSKGTGTFRGNEHANPAIGMRGQLEFVDEVRLEILVPRHKQRAILQALLHAHPYEEVAYELYAIENEHPEIGAGMLGMLPQPMPIPDFFAHLKTRMNLRCFKHTAPHKETVQRIAVCGGAGSFLLKAARAAHADVLVTSDFKYHEFFDAEQEIIIADIGHFESEIFTNDLLIEYLSPHCMPASVPLYAAKTYTNPVQYFC